MKLQVILVILVLAVASLQESRAGEPINVMQHNDHPGATARAIQQVSARATADRIAAVDVDASALLQGVSISDLPDRDGLVTATRNVRFNVFPDTDYRLRNTSLHRISPQAVGWWGEVLDANGMLVGHARLLIEQEGTRFSGNIRVPAHSRTFVLESLGKDQGHVVYEAAPYQTDLSDDLEEQPDEERAVAVQQWRERLQSEEYRERREARERLLEGKKPE